jgi:hypothetical protein
MNDEPNRPDEDRPEEDKVARPQEPRIAPAPWERRTPERPQEAPELRHQLSGGDETEYTADEAQQATYLADEDQSLGSKLVGGGRDKGEEAKEGTPKLCPGCGAVTTFVQGVCSNCGYKPGSGAEPPAEVASGFGAPAYAPAARQESPLLRILLIVFIAVVLVAVLAYVFLKYSGTTASSEATNGSETTAMDDPGVFNPATIDDAFYERVRTALELGNEAWAAAGVDAYVYRYRVYEKTESGSSQVIHISCYVGGNSASSAVELGGDESFREGTSSFMDKLNDRTGVSATVLLYATNGEEPPAPEDEYIRYGYYYGKEHLETIQPIIDALAGEKERDGQYPLALSEMIVRPKIRTYGGLKFISKGYGYLPVFKTNSSGHVIMGSGKGLQAYLPEEIVGYMLFVYTNSSNEGLDMYSQAALTYYKEKISPFPYTPKEALTNVSLDPDGKPDGIACVVRNGELLGS